MNTFIHYLDFFTMIVNLACTYFLARAKIIAWPIGILGLLLSALLFGLSSLYADTLLQLILIPGFMYGWYKWNSKSDTKLFETSMMKLSGWVYSAVFVIMFTYLVAMLLIHYTDSNTPYLDSFASVTSILCVYLSSKKFIENWLVWIVVDSIYTSLYIYKGIYFAAFTTLIYLIIAVYGFYVWKSRYRYPFDKKKEHQSI